VTAIAPGSLDATGLDTVLVVDFGAQYAQLIARRVREAHVYSEIVPHTISAAEVAARAPAAIVYSGGPKSVHQPGAPLPDPAILDLGIPTLGICYGIQVIARQLGGVVERNERGEYGRTSFTQTSAADAGPPSSVLFDQVPPRFDVWMSHFDAVVEAPPGFRVTGSSPEQKNIK
jgi:GMP synthase (glutamine-hydrolysing)